MLLTTWQPSIAVSAIPKYLALVAAIEGDIAAGVLKHGDKLPPQREIAEHMGVTIATITKAIREASRRGIVTAKTGSGTFIRVGDEAVATDWGAVDLSLNTIPPLLTKDFLDEALTEIASRRCSEMLFNYEVASGTEQHRAIMAKWFRQRGFAVSPSSILLTHGGQHGLSLCLHGLMRPGETVLTEQWTYPGILRLANLCNLKVAGVAIDQGGLCPVDLKAKLESTGARTVICSAVVQNPTTATMSLERRREVLAVCAEADAIVVEDDIYGALADGLQPTLASLDPRRVVHVSSVSKCLATGIRLGSLVASEELMPLLQNALLSLHWTAPTFWIELLGSMMDNGLAERCLNAHRKEALLRIKLFEDVMGEPASTSLPSYHVWHPIPPPWRADDLAAELASRGVKVSPSKHFEASLLDAGSSNYVRICLGGSDDRSLLRSQLNVLKNTMNERPRHKTTIV